MNVASDVPAGLAACITGAARCAGTGRVEYREHGELNE